MANINPEFIAFLRNELLKQQDKRAEYIKVKFTFVVALFGLFTLLDKANFNSILILLIPCIIPVIALLFDLYILGGEFSVKRIRAFLFVNDLTGENEKQWSQFLEKYPKAFMANNRKIVTLFIILLSFFVSYLIVIPSFTLCARTIIWILWQIGVSVFYVITIKIEERIKKAKQTLN